MEQNTEGFEVIEHEHHMDRWEFTREWRCWYFGNEYEPWPALTFGENKS